MQGYLTDLEDNKTRYYVVANTALIAFKNHEQYMNSYLSGGSKEKIKLIKYEMELRESRRVQVDGNEFCIHLDTCKESKNGIRRYLTKSSKQASAWSDYLSVFTLEAMNARGDIPIPGSLNTAIIVCGHYITKFFENDPKYVRCLTRVPGKHNNKNNEIVEIEKMAAEMVTGAASINPGTDICLVVGTLCRLLDLLPETILTRSLMATFKSCTDDKTKLETLRRNIHTVNEEESFEVEQKEGEKDQHGRGKRGIKVKETNTASPPISVNALRLTRKRKLKKIKVSVNNGVLTWKPCSKNFKQFELKKSTLYSPVPDWPLNRRLMKHRRISIRLLQENVAIDLAFADEDAYDQYFPMLQAACKELIHPDAAQSDDRSVALISVYGESPRTTAIYARSPINSSTKQNQGIKFEEESGDDDTRIERVATNSTEFTESRDYPPQEPQLMEFRREERHPTNTSSSMHSPPISEEAAAAARIPTRIEIDYLVQMIFDLIDNDGTGIIDADKIERSMEKLPLSAEESMKPSDVLDVWKMGRKELTFPVFRDYIRNQNFDKNEQVLKEFASRYGVFLSNNTGGERSVENKSVVGAGLMSGAALPHDDSLALPNQQKNG